MGGRTWRAKVVVLGLLLASLAGAPAGASEASVRLSVDRWSLDSSTGRVSYGLTVRGWTPCNCLLKLHTAIERDGELHYAGYLGHTYVGTSYGVYEARFSGDGVEVPPSDHVLVELVGATHLADSGWMPTGAVYAPAWVELDVDRWDLVDEHNRATFNVNVRAGGLAGPQGPCEAKVCQLRVDAATRRDDGSLEHVGHLLQASPRAWTFAHSLAEEEWTLPWPITHLKAIVVGTDGTREIATEWVPVAEYAGMRIDVRVDLWDDDETTDRLYFDASASAVGLAGSDACRRTGCTLRLDALGVGPEGGLEWRGIIAQGRQAVGGWSIWAGGSGQRSAGEYTHVVAYLLDGAGTEHASTGPIDLRAGVHHGIHVALLAGMLAARGSGLEAFCESVYLTAQPDPTPHTTTDGGDELCLAAEAGGVGLRDVLRDFVLLFAGGTQAYTGFHEVLAGLPSLPFDEIIRGAPVPGPRYTPLIEYQLEEQLEEQQAPEPEASGDGSFAGLPPRCIDVDLHETLLRAPFQEHHIVTDKRSDVAEEARTILANGRLIEGLNARFGTRDVLQGRWNLLAIPHAGPHPEGYHDWVMRNLAAAASASKGDVEQFVRLFRTHVRLPLLGDPAAVRKAWWDCQ